MSKRKGPLIYLLDLHSMKQPPDRGRRLQPGGHRPCTQLLFQGLSQVLSQGPNRMFWAPLVVSDPEHRGRVSPEYPRIWFKKQKRMKTQLDWFWSILWPTAPVKATGIWNFPFRMFTAMCCIKILNLRRALKGRSILEQQRWPAQPSSTTHPPVLVGHS